MLGTYYQPPPPLHIRRRREFHREPPRENSINLHYFHGKEDVEIHLDWEMKVEQLFACHQVSEGRKVPLVTLCFQGNPMYWSTSRKGEENQRCSISPILEWPYECP